MKLIISTDGGSRGNPGPAAIGIVISDQRSVIRKYSEYLGEATNNEAEYQAVIFALKKAKLLFGKKKARRMKVEVRADSELLIKQLNHQYKIQEKNLQPLFLQIWNLMLDFKSVKFVYIPRDQNKEADRLVNQTLDSQMKTQPLF